MILHKILEFMQIFLPKETASTTQANMFDLCLAYNGSQDEKVENTTKLDMMLFGMISENWMIDVYCHLA